jgi:thioesterase domain-containing protein
LLPAGQIGEVVIRGPHVLRNYENNPAADAASFRDGWFRTGDLGSFDQEGYLFIQGRLKEVINRGGEKIAPREVDEALLGHPAVAQALAFALPHPTLGEDVAAAVVLRAPASPADPSALPTEKDLRDFVAARLADFKVPRRVLLLPEIPKGPTGKPQRIGLAEKLGLTATGAAAEDKAGFTAPRNPTEEVLASVWAELLRLPKIGVHDDFFQCGGNSLLAATMVARIRKKIGQFLPLAAMVEGATIEHVARVLDQQLASGSSLVALQPAGAQPPFYCVAGVGGEVLSLLKLARRMGPDYPFHGLQMQRSSEGAPVHRSVEEMAARYVEEICAFQPEGPYFLGGVSFGGSVAFEMAQQLQAQGRQVGLLAILDHIAPGRTPSWTPSFGVRFLANCCSWIRYDLLETKQVGVWRRAGMKLRLGIKRLGNVCRRRPSSPAAADLVQSIFDTSRLPDVFRKTLEVHYQAMLNYEPAVYPGRATLIRARAQPLFRAPRHDLGWGKLAAGGVDVSMIPGNHASILTEPYVQLLAERLKAQIRKAHAAEGAPSLPTGPAVAVSSRS